MSTAIVTVAAEKARLPIVINDRFRIPPWVVDHDSYRRWARSDDYPESGWFSYLNGEIWVDLSMEQVFSHNLVKTEFATVLGGLVKKNQVGYYFPDRRLFSHPGAGLTTEPDGMFACWETVQSERLRLVEGTKEGYVELEGSPAMVLEIVSFSSIAKDTKILRKLYAQAAIPEYWLVDARGEAPSFIIFELAAKRYAPVRRQNGGWLKSAVFGKRFRFSQQSDPLGHPQYNLEVQP